VFLIQAVILNDCRFSALREPANKRRAALEDSLRFHMFVFEVDAQQQWIKEHLPLAASEKLGQNLHQAQSLHKKHHKLEAEIVSHQAMIDRTLASGQDLNGQSQPETKQVWTNILLQ
jgi:spectrin beta